MLLHFQDLSKLKTKKVIFEGTYYARDSGTLEQLKELSSRRRAVEDCVNGSSSVTEAIAREMAGGITSRIQQDLQKLEFYLPLLENLLIYVESVRSNNQIHQWTADLKIRWTSALNGSSSFSIGGPKFFRIDDLQYELAMILFLYGSLQRERAVELLSSGAEFFVESASLYRKAAGVFENLAQNVLPNLQPKLPPERPPEVMPVISSALCLVCLADAQAVAARMAESKGASTGTLAKLHYGTVQFLEEAMNILVQATDWNELSDKFKRFFHGCLLLHEARSQRYVSAELKGNDELGVAIGVLRYAMHNFQGKLPPEESWRKTYKEEMESLTQMLRKCENENDFIWHQKLPSENELPILEGKKIVAPIKYESAALDREFIFIM